MRNVSSRGIFDTLADIGAFIRNLFVPDGNYFNDQLFSLNDHINSRFACLGQLRQITNDFFKALSGPPGISLDLTILNNFLFPKYRGTKIDFRTSGRPYIEFINMFISIFLLSRCLMIVPIAYNLKLVWSTLVWLIRKIPGMS